MRAHGLSARTQPRTEASDWGDERRVEPARARGSELARALNVFGPFYPPALQTVINHAERLSELLGIHELAPPTQEWARAWMTGRADEVVRFAEHVVGLWRDGKLREPDAAATLEGYLGTLHEGLAKHLRCDAPSCCVADEATTVRPGRRRRGRRPATGTTGGPEDATALGTVDSLLLAELLTPHED